MSSRPAAALAQQLAGRVAPSAPSLPCHARQRWFGFAARRRRRRRRGPAGRGAPPVAPAPAHGARVAAPWPWSGLVGAGEGCKGEQRRESSRTGLASCRERRRLGPQVVWRRVDCRRARARAATRQNRRGTRWGDGTARPGTAGRLVAGYTRATHFTPQRPSSPPRTWHDRSAGGCDLTRLQGRLGTTCRRFWRGPWCCHLVCGPRGRAEPAAAGRKTRGGRQVCVCVLEQESKAFREPNRQ